MGKETKNYNMMDIRCVETVSGVVYEKEYFRKGWRGIVSGSPRPPRERFKTEEERKQHGENMSRKKHARLVNANFEPGDLYVTLTCNAQNEAHTVEDARWIRDNFVRRLKYKYPNAVIFIYFGRGRKRGRFHFHALIKGVPVAYVFQQWPYGKMPPKNDLNEKEKQKEREFAQTRTELYGNHTCKLEPGEAKSVDGFDVEGLDLNRSYNGVDHGADYTGLANYLFDHWTEELGGHRWKMTRNALHPEREEDFTEPEEVRQQYTVDNPPPAPKGYIWVESRSTVYGYLYFKYVKKPPKKGRKRASK